MAVPRKCIRCHQLGQIKGRELCSTCHDSCRHNGTLLDYPRKRRLLIEFTEDYSVHRQRGLTHKEIAVAMGYQPRTVGRMCTRARAAGLLSAAVTQ